MVWDESKHPRDNDGKFARYNSMSIDELKREAIVNIGLHYFSNSTPPTFDPDEVRSNIPSDIYGFANKERLNTNHHKRHADEMGFSDQTDYQNAAIAFWHINREKTFYNPYDDAYCRYDLKTRFFISVSRDGVIHTFMRFRTANGFERIKKQEAMYEL